MEEINKDNALIRIKGKGMNFQSVGKIFATPVNESRENFATRGGGGFRDKKRGVKKDYGDGVGEVHRCRGAINSEWKTL